MKIYVPTSSLTWCKNINSATYMSARASMLLELWNEDTNTLIERRWDRNGGVFGDNNHPEGSDITVPDGTILKLVAYNLSKNKLPMQVIVFNSDTTNTNSPTTFPKGMVNGAGAISGSSALTLQKEIIGGQKVEMRFQATTVSQNWWKININCFWLSGAEFTTTNPNDGIDYGADFFNLSYYGGNIRWNNPSISSGNQIFFPNTSTWPTESGTASNNWYDANNGNVDCSVITAGKLLSTWNNAGNGITTLLNQPIETWNLNGDGFWALKVIKKDENGNPVWFEARGRDFFLQFPLAPGVTESLKGCLMGQDVGYNLQENYPIPSGYIKDGSVYKKTIVPSAPVPSSSSILLGNIIAGIADQAGTINIYQQNSSTIVATVSTSGTNNAWVWNPTSVGVYHFKNSNANGLSPYSSTVSVTQSSSGEFDYTITQIDNDCGKNIEYGIQENLGTQIEWQSSNVFLNKTYTNPLLYIRNANIPTEVSAPYQISI